MALSVIFVGKTVLCQNVKRLDMPSKEVREKNQKLT